MTQMALFFCSSWHNLANKNIMKSSLCLSLSIYIGVCVCIHIYTYNKFPPKSKPKKHETVVLMQKAIHKFHNQIREDGDLLLN